MYGGRGGMYRGLGGHVQRNMWGYIGEQIKNVWRNPNQLNQYMT